MDKTRKDLGSGVGPKPGDFPLGSMQSRAAARSQIEQAKRETKTKVRIFHDGVLETEYEYEGMEEDLIVLSVSGGHRSVST